MPLDRLDRTLADELADLEAKGTLKGAEDVITEVVPATQEHGPRYRLAGHDTPFLRMNANAYLGLSLRPELIEAEEEASRRYGVGPGAVRFISGTWQPHVDLEARLAEFHGRESAMAFSSAYAAIVGILTPLLTSETVVISDELNHNCIINALRMARPGAKHVYPHLDLETLEARLRDAAGQQRRAVVATDGIFSMRGDHAPLDRIQELAERWHPEFPEGVVTVVDDSHGVGAFGETGRGTEEYTGARCDVLVATLGKSLGVNGGYVVTSGRTIEWLREKAPMYVYSNPITPGEAAAARRAVDLLDSDEGRRRVAHVRELTRTFKDGLVRLGHETLPGEHPVVPLMVRDTDRTSALVRHLKDHAILATGLNYPVVPKGDESIRFQLSAEHTRADLDHVLDVLGRFGEGRGT